VEYSSSYDGSQEAEKDNAYDSSLSASSLFVPSRPPSYSLVLPKFRMDLPLLVNCRRQGSLCEPFCLDLDLEHFAVVCPNFSISSTRWRRPCFSSGSLPCRRCERAPYSRTSQPACTSSYPSLPQHINTPV
jgi:hypothetical protein